MLPFQESVYRTSFDTHFTYLAGITKRSSKAHFTAVSAASEEQYSNCGKVCNPYDAWETCQWWQERERCRRAICFFFNFFIILRGCNCAKFALKYGSARPQKSLEQYAGLRKTANFRIHQFEYHPNWPKDQNYLSWQNTTYLFNAKFFLYRPGLPQALRGVSFSTTAGEKVTLTP